MKFIFTALVFFALFFAVNVNAQNKNTATEPAAIVNATTATQTIDATTFTKKQQVQATITQKKTVLQQRLQAIKDEKKKALVERINEKIINVNAQRTDQMLKVLARMQTVLDKLNLKIQEAKTAGKDTAAAETVYTAAKKAVDAAVLAVNAQAAKTYTPTITDDLTLKNNVGKTVALLAADLKATHKMVADAKQAVQNAAMEVAHLNGKNIGIGESGLPGRLPPGTTGVPTGVPTDVPTVTPVATITTAVTVAPTTSSQP